MNSKIGLIYTKNYFNVLLFNVGKKVIENRVKMVTEKGINTKGLYSLFNNIIFVMTLMAGMAAVYYGYIIGTDTILNEWQGHCSQFKDPVEYNNCMVLSFKLINHYKKLLMINLAIAIALPVIFRGGGRLYKRYSLRH